jgi:hypothetical protein
VDWLRPGWSMTAQAEVALAEIERARSVILNAGTDAV